MTTTLAAAPAPTNAHRVSAPAATPCPQCGRPAPRDGTGDRYVSFLGLDCDGRARSVMACIDRLLADPARENKFWIYFQKKRNPPSGPQPDDLLLIHSSINQVRELFEACSDAEALALLDDLEETCC